jgi:oligoribonuclease NrnB/cAMP/cGMP phosphodiesterase (DHH superfamily)
MTNFLKSFINPIWFITYEDNDKYTLKVISKGITRSLVTTNNKEYLLKLKQKKESLLSLKENIFLDSFLQ